jgi:tetratricopeptide (TPR) repeat protein
LTAAACEAGVALTAGEYALVAPEAGRFKVVSGLLTLEREIRTGTENDPLVPQLISPRSTTLRSPRPTISWLRVSDAIEYRVELSGRSAVYDTQLKAEELVCARDADGANLCTLRWPADRQDLGSDETFFLRIAARGRLVAPWHWTEPVKVRTQAKGEATDLEKRLQDPGGFGLEGSARDLAQAGLLAQAELYMDAIDAYRRAFAAAPSPELSATLGDLYLTVGLLTLAEPRYREAARNGGPAVEAAAMFGLGRIEYARTNYREAAKDFQKAHELYEKRGLGEEEVAARQAAEKAAARAPV